MNIRIEPGFVGYILKFSFLLFCSVLHADPLTPEQQAAKVRGITLYNQYKDGEPDLRIAATAGDREAQYYLAEDLRHTARYMTADAEKWYTAAADQGDYYAMYRLSGKGSDFCAAMGNCPKGQKTAGDWLLQGQETAKALAEKGDAEAMYVLHFLTNDDTWLEKSVAAGYPIAQWYLASQYRDGEGFFLFPWNRSKRVKELFKQSAEGGYPNGMGEYAHWLQKEGDKSSAKAWILKGAEAGYTSTFSEYAYALSNPKNRWGIETNYVKSYGLMSLMLELNGGGNILEFTQETLKKIATHLTPEQIEQAKKIGAEWKATHPPLSFFPGKLGY